MAVARRTLAWHLFTLARTLLAATSRLAGVEVTLGPLTGRAARALRRVDRPAAIG